MTLLVSLESPFAGDLHTNIPYAHKICLDSIARGESPYASHLFFPQFLLDDNPVQRELGLSLSDAWRLKAERIIFYVDLGFSSGMQRAFELAKTHSIPIEFRALSGQVSQALLHKLGITLSPVAEALSPEDFIDFPDSAPFETNFTDVVDAD